MGAPATLEDGTARSVHDYLGNAGDLTVAPGTTSGTIRVGSVDNDLSEPDETFTIEIHTPVNANLGDATATGTIVDDEAPPVIEREAAISIAEARSRRLQVSFEDRPRHSGRGGLPHVRPRTVDQGGGSGHRPVRCANEGRRRR